jgi:DNA mismatch repair protein MutS2
VASPDTAATLELARALDLVAGWAAGPLGAESVRARRPGVDGAAIARRPRSHRRRIELSAIPKGSTSSPRPDSATAERLRIAECADGPDLVSLKIALTAARLVALELKRVSSRAPMIATLAVAVPERRIEQRLEAALDEQGELFDNASPGLLRARRAVQAARERLVKKLEAMLRGADPQAVPSGATVTMRNGCYVIPVRRDARPAPPASCTTNRAARRSSRARGRYRAGERAARQSDESREVLARLRELTDLLRPHHEAIRAAHAMCIAADDLQARARYARAVVAEVPAIAEPGRPSSPGRPVIRCSCAGGHRAVRPGPRGRSGRW